MVQKLKILFEDEALLVCDKPFGIPVQSQKIGVPDLETMVRKELYKRTGSKVSFLSCVHRLDQPVEGLVLFAKTKESMANLSNQIKNHSAGKYYLAVVEGAFEEPQMTLADYLKKDGKHNHSLVVNKGEPGGKLSQLEYKVLETSGQHQLLEIHLLTGRHHQIRVQMSHAGHPIVEDVRYNPTCQNRKDKMQPALCAYKLLIEHPVTKERLQFIKKPVGKHFIEFSSCLEKL
ncbi:MAG: RNA pseudouridine synthase [Lachnospiraceae bacterium]|nr:RNA pseudouridine synthase [Lachnospiraceae bacterium]